MKNQTIKRNFSWGFKKSGPNESGGKNESSSLHVIRVLSAAFHRLEKHMKRHERARNTWNTSRIRLLFCKRRWTWCTKNVPGPVLLLSLWVPRCSVWAKEPRAWMILNLFYILLTIACCSNSPLDCGAAKSGYWHCLYPTQVSSSVSKMQTSIF